jgi:ABC-type lipoprotein export system ATPase subunit
MEPLFEIEGVRCSYDKPFREGASKVVLEIRHMLLPRGKKVFIVGESGIGKSTILEVLGLMNNTIVPDPQARFVFNAPDGTSTDIIALWRRGSDDELSAFRRRHFNFVFQSTNLMRNFTAYENISITRMLQGYGMEETFAKAAGVLADLGLEHVGRERMAQELSGGQQQRLAFARAVLPDFTVLFGDEPTGNLDSDNAVRAMELLTEKLSHLEGSSAIIVSHDMHLAAAFADIIIKIRKESDGSGAADEASFHGVIDDSCVFTPQEFLRLRQ